MKINFITQFENINSIVIDYFISSSGFETRSSYFFNENKGLFTNSKKICFQFNDRKLHARKHNDKIYESNGFSFITVKTDIIEDYIIIFDDLFKSANKKILNIVIDFSSMTTMIYASLLKYFNSYSINFLEVNLFFIYTQAEYTTPLKSDSLSINQPISIYNTIQTTDKKIALIIGLGYERDKALGLYEYFQNDKEDIYLYVAKNSEHDPFYVSASENNKDIINMVDENNIIYYALDNIQHLISSLDSLVSYLISSNKRVIIAPTGPKQFTLVSLLINLFHKDVTTYRISHGIKSEAVDKIPNIDKSPIISVINFKVEQMND